MVRSRRTSIVMQAVRSIKPLAKIFAPGDIGRYGQAPYSLSISTGGLYLPSKQLETHGGLNDASYQWTVTQPEGTGMYFQVSSERIASRLQRQEHRADGRGLVSFLSILLVFAWARFRSPTETVRSAMSRTSLSVDQAIRAVSRAGAFLHFEAWLRCRPSTDHPNLGDAFFSSRRSSSSSSSAAPQSSSQAQRFVLGFRRLRRLGRVF